MVEVEKKKEEQEAREQTYLQARYEVCGFQEGQLADLVYDAGDFGASRSIGRVLPPRDLVLNEGS